MRIEFKVVEPAAMRYPTAGDWEWLPDGALKLTVPDYGTTESGALLILMHELLEAFLCKRDGISDEAVTKFDTENPKLEEPGDDPRAPYHQQHLVAMAAERNLADGMGVDWDSHNHWVMIAGNEVERLDSLGELQESRILMEGPRYWAELHLYALRNEGKGRDMVPWVLDWFSDLPFEGCPCKEHAEKWFRENPPDNQNLFEWSVLFHNEVNSRNFKPCLSIDAARNLWQNRLF
jgi:hypothetical protein